MELEKHKPVQGTYLNLLKGFQSSFYARENNKLSNSITSPTRKRSLQISSMNSVPPKFTNSSPNSSIDVNSINKSNSSNNNDGNNNRQEKNISMSSPVKVSLHNTMPQNQNSTVLSSSSSSNSNSIMSNSLFNNSQKNMVGSSAKKRSPFV